MDRQIVYPGSIPLETDLLNTNKYAMMGLAKLAAAMMGSNTYLHGLACTPSSPASMVINVAKGQIYSLQNVDGSAYSSLAADTVNTILKQGVVLNSTTFTLTAPTTAGQSINYLIQVAYSDTDSGATVLPYYNAANPSVAYSGPNNAGTAQNTVRSGVCTVALKAGVAATTGTQTTPSADTGYTAAWVITVAQGATTITAANIAVAANAPFLPAAGVFSATQQGAMTYAADTGAANAYVASYQPALPALTDGMRLMLKAKTANTGASTLAVNGGSAYPLYSPANQALQGGEIIANGLIEVKWNSTLTAWVMCGNSGGALPVAAASQSNHAMQLGQAFGRLIGPPIQITSSGIYTPSPGAKSILVECIGGGGGGGGLLAPGTSGHSVTGGGGGGGYALSSITSLAASYSVTIGASGSGGTAGAAGGNGGITSFGTLCVAAGGGGGNANTTTDPTTTAIVSIAGIPGVGTTGNVLISGGERGESGVGTANGNLGGSGGSSRAGRGGVRVGASAGSVSNGFAGLGFGSGGSGAAAAATTTGAVGGAGTSGVVIVWEYS